MEMKLEEAQVCRLCGQCESIFIDVFGEEGTKRFLGLKIHTKVNIVINEADGLSHYVCMRCIGTLEFIDEFQQNCQRTQRNFVAAKKLQKCPRIKVSSPTSGASTLDDPESDKENASPIVTPSRKRKRPSSTIEDAKVLKPLALSTNRSLTISINESDRVIAEKSLVKSDQKKTPLASHNPACSPGTKGKCDGGHNVSHKSACPPSTKSTCDGDTKTELPEAKIPDDTLLRSPDTDPSTPRTRIRASARAVPKGSPNDAKTASVSPRSKSLGLVIKLEKAESSESHEKSNEPDSIPIERVKLPEAERPKSSRAEPHHDECPIAGDEAGKRVEKSPESSASRATTLTGEKSVISSTKVLEESAANLKPNGHVTPRSTGKKNVTERLAPTVSNEKSATSSTAIRDESVATKSAARKVETPKENGLGAPRSTGKRRVAKLEETAPTRQRRELREPRSIAKKYAEEKEDDDDENDMEDDEEESRKKFGKISDLITTEQKEAIEKFYTLDMSVVDEEVVGEKIVFLDRRTYGCKICKASYPRQDKCQVHIWGHLGMRPYRCNACDFATVTVSNIRCHIRKSHLKIKPYACELCEKRYVTAFLLEEHINTHTGSRPYSCNLCKFTSASRQVLSYHKSTHKPVKDITCHVCGKEFYSKGRMRAHMVIHNKDKAANMCKLCSIYLCNSEALERHHANVHSQDYVCNVCGKRCKSKKALGNHQNVHSAAKYKCTLCSNVYKSSHILKEHLLKHKGIRKYKCNVCGKDFAQQSHLAAHMAVHSEKRFLCPGCKRPFNRHDNMKMHTKRCDAFLANPELSSLLTIRRSRSKPADESRLGADPEKSPETEQPGKLPSDSQNFVAPNSQGQMKLLAVGGPNDEPVVIEDLPMIIGNTIVIPCT